MSDDNIINGLTDRDCQNAMDEDKWISEMAQKEDGANVSAGSLDADRKQAAIMARKLVNTSKTGYFLCALLDTEYGTMYISVSPRYMFVNNSGFLDQRAANHELHFNEIPFETRIHCTVQKDNTYKVDDDFGLVYNTNKGIISYADNLVIRENIITKINQWMTDNKQLINDCMILDIQEKIKEQENTMVKKRSEIQRLTREVNGCNVRISELDKLLEKYN